MLAYSPLLKLKQVKHGWFPETDAAPRCMHCNGQREVQLCEGFTVMVLGGKVVTCPGQVSDENSKATAAGELLLQ